MPDIERVSSAYVPYRKRADGTIEIYLQRRDLHVASPNALGFFGGGVETSETPDQTLMREVQEELELTPSQPICLGAFKDGVPERIVLMYVEPVRDDFEDQVTIHEGQYGRFVSRAELESEEKVAAGLHSLYARLFERLGTL